VTDERNPVDQVIDLFVYAPIGLALSARDELPALVEKGRSRVEGQVAMARVIGQFALAQGQKEAEKLVRQAVERLQGPASPPAAAPAPEAATAPTPRRAPAPATAPAGRRRPDLSDDHLAIPGYDSLSASQVLPRLTGLDRAELEAVRAYESAGRKRRTILNRIEQLQAGA
jgi:hypothetical protein